MTVQIGLDETTRGTKETKQVRGAEKLMKICAGDLILAHAVSIPRP